MRARAIVVAGILALAAAVPAGAEIIEEIVAVVNGDIITKTELEERERQVKAQLYGNLAGEELDAAMEQTRKSLLVDMINEKLLYQRAERLGLDLEQVYRSAVENIKNQNNIESDDELLKLLQQQGMTLEEFRENLLKYNVPDIMINIEVRQKIAITDAEAEAYYEEHREAWLHPATYTFREVAFLLSDHGRREARDLAEKVIAEASAGAEFDQLVETYSEAPSKEAGGLIENLPAPDMSPPILEALEPLEPGEVSGVVETTRALFVLQLLDRTQAYLDPLEEVRPRIAALLKRTKFAEQLDVFLREMWDENIIDVRPKYEKRFPTDMYR